MYIDAESLPISGTDILQIVLIVLILGLLAFVIFRSMRSEKTVVEEEEVSVESLLYSTPEVVLDDIDSDGDQIPDENLCFIGDISSGCVPFNYAMDVANNYNDPGAPTQYITYTSGFPQNLQIQMKLLLENSQWLLEVLLD